MRREFIDGLGVGHGGDPAGTRLVFVHGAMDRGAGFLRTVRHLDEFSWTVYDRRGYGRSLVDDSASPSTFDRHVDDLIGLLDATAVGGPSVVVGHSLGGTVALAAAARRPELISSLLVHEAPLPWLPWWPLTDDDGRRIEDDGPSGAVERFMSRVIGRESWEQLPPSTRAQRFAEGPTLVAELVSVRGAPPFVGPEIPVPVMIGIGSLADPIRVRASQHLVQVLPNARIAAIDGAPHGAQGTHPGPFADLVRRTVEMGSGGARPTT